MAEASTEREVRAIEETARAADWSPAEPQVGFLAAGEYNRNYLVESGDERFVFRVNCDTQLNIDDQIEYEYSVLECVAPSGVTPKPIHLGRRSPDFPRGYLVMEWLPGRPLDYRTDTPEAARIFGALHALPLPGSPSRELIVQRNPIADIVEESTGLLNRYEEHPLQEEGRKIAAYRDRIANLGERLAPEFEAERMMVVNTEVNSGNFLIHDSGSHLVDWEKAVVSQRYQDLGHFLVITTTRWKTDFVFGPEERIAFLRTYTAELQARGETPPPFDTLDRLTGALEATIVLRGLSWCYMAYYQYTQTERQIRNDDTFETIRSYMREIDELTQWARIG